ncbi:TetR/AcrR family transcriptional regulator [Bombilactobacillus bombi]|uniref:TetR/AcrR family transcriptional regulator n=1 Tax=Bombilactobacillus bombi TaxID=1303590 RepID=UPI0015E60871|nr:TetR/AcrR family transcriptional regulator [Bombilactobacillus bombi]MBA1435311.1 TetR/AcrR family transcriptional regulator [Bombilactobacillus bombi]
MPKKDNKSKLIHATDKLLKKNSLLSITIKDITDTAGVSVGVFYNYFRSKEDIFKEVIKFFFKYSLDEIKKLKKEITGNNVRSEVKFKEFLINGIDKNWENQFLNSDITMMSIKDEQFNKMMIDYSEQTIELISDILVVIQPKIKKKPIITATIIMNLIQNSNPVFSQLNSNSQKEIYIDEFVNIIYNICFEENCTYGYK